MIAAAVDVTLTWIDIGIVAAVCVLVVVVLSKL